MFTHERELELYECTYIKDWRDDIYKNKPTYFRSILFPQSKYFLIRNIFCQFYYLLQYIFFNLRKQMFIFFVLLLEKQIHMYTLKKVFLGRRPPSPHIKRIYSFELWKHDILSRILYSPLRNFCLLFVLMINWFIKNSIVCLPAPNLLRFCSKTSA